MCFLSVKRVIEDRRSTFKPERACEVETVSQSFVSLRHSRTIRGGTEGGNLSHLTLLPAMNHMQPDFLVTIFDDSEGICLPKPKIFAVPSHDYE